MDDEGNIYQSIKYAFSNSLLFLVLRPYIMDLESTNKTFLNGDQIEPARYYELREKDLLKFAFSSREYVIMNAGKIESD
jgi:smad nuclear-interacting protein 1